MQTTETEPRVMPLETRQRLPEPQNSGAALVVKAADKIGSALVHLPQADRDSFTYAMVVAANESNLAECVPLTILMAAYNSARLGLPPGRAQGLCFFVPFKDSKRKVTECQLVVGYRGWIDLATKNNYVAALDADVVTKEEFEAGDFKFWNDETGPRLEHRPHLDRNPTKQNIVAAYCTAHLASGRHQVTVLPVAKLAKSERDTPAWKYAFDEMCMKTAIHRASKRWRLTPQLQLAGALADAEEIGQSQLAIAPIPGELNGNGEITPEQIKDLQAELERTGTDIGDFLLWQDVVSLDAMTKQQFAAAMDYLKRGNRV